MTLAPSERVFVVGADDLRAYATEVFRLAGLVDERGADLAARALVEADLRGVHSHGVQNLPRWARGYQQGLLNPAPKCEVVTDSGVLAVMDADGGLGAVVGCDAMDLAIERATEHGVGMVGVRNSSHFGTAAWLSMRALEHDQIGYCTTNGPPVMAPWGGRQSVLSNNPFSYAIPTSHGAPIVLDIACSASARGRIRAHARDGRPIPPDWAIDADGRQTTDAARALTGSVMPFGAHKGYGIAVVDEVLAGALTGARFSFEIELGAAGATDEIKRHAQPSWGCGHWLIAIQIARLQPVERFKQRVDDLREWLASSPPSDGVDRVLLPGEIEHELSLVRSRDGIPLSPSTVGLIDEFARDELRTRPVSELCHPVERSAVD